LRVGADKSRQCAMELSDTNIIIILDQYVKNIIIHLWN
jgi:hypothetical protein